MSRRFRLLFGVTAAVVLLAAYTASAAANVVSPSKAGSNSFAISWTSFVPLECAGMVLTGVVSGGSGTSASELVLGTAANDNLNGGGGAGADCIVGGAGNDQILGGNGPDVIVAGPGNDVIDAKSGDDRVYGGDGNDVLTGSQGNDYLDGGPGNDVCTGGPGTDTAMACETVSTVP